MDSDCMLTCRQGAVNRRWYKANEEKLKHCKGGCAGGNRVVKCIEGECVAYWGDKRDDDCTRQNIEWR